MLWAIIIGLFFGGFGIINVLNSTVSQGNTNEVLFGVTAAIVLGFGFFLAIYVPYWTLNRIRQHTLNNATIAGRLFLCAIPFFIIPLFIIPFFDAAGMEILGSISLFVYAASVLIGAVYLAMSFYHLTLIVYCTITHKNTPDTTSKNHVALYMVLAIIIIYLLPTLARLINSMEVVLVIAGAGWIVWYVIKNRPRTVAIGVSLIVIGPLISWLYSYYLHQAQAAMNQPLVQALYSFSGISDIFFLVFPTIGLIYLIKYALKKY